MNYIRLDVDTNFDNYEQILLNYQENDYVSFYHGLNDMLLNKLLSSLNSGKYKLPDPQQITFHQTT